MNNYFLQFVYTLRNENRIAILSEAPIINASEKPILLEFMGFEYEEETQDFPFQVPKFDPEIAYWSAKILYFSSHFYIFRGQNIKEISNLFEPCPKSSITATEMLSADLFLRFLPQIYKEIKNIDTFDSLLNLIEPILAQFHYSNIFSNPELTAKTEEELPLLFEDDCFKQLYTDRVIEHNAYQLCAIPCLNKSIKESLGNHQNIFWTQFTNQIHTK